MIIDIFAHCLWGRLGCLMTADSRTHACTHLSFRTENQFTHHIEPNLPWRHLLLGNRAAPSRIKRSKPFYVCTVRYMNTLPHSGCTDARAHTHTKGDNQLLPASSNTIASINISPFPFVFIDHHIPEMI